jgi:hypothetical protein
VSKMTKIEAEEVLKKRHWCVIHKCRMNLSIEWGCFGDREYYTCMECVREARNASKAELDEALEVLRGEK